MLGRTPSFAVAGAAGVATLTAASAPSPLYPVYKQLWGFSAFTLTLVFAVYVFALLIALLTVGSLSDRTGRRPVASAALLLLALGMLLFAIAGGAGGLMAARIVQGLAVGAATGTTTAMIMDSAPSPRSGSILSSAVPTLGIAVGAILAGALVEFAPHPRQLVFCVLGLVYLLLAALVWLVPERARSEAPPSESIWRSLRPSAGLPSATRPVFLSLVPSISATWALGGLYLSLGSSILGKVLGVHSHFVVGVVLGAFFAVGVLATIVATVTGSLPVYVVGSVVAGLGFGATFRFAVSALGEAAPPARRGQVFATMYIVSYVAFSVPALAAGVAVEQSGLKPTAVAYGVLDVALVLLAAVAGGIRARRSATEVSVPSRRADSRGTAQ